MGRPAHKPTEESRSLVRRLAGMAVAHDDIASFVEISDISLRKHYRADLDRGRAEANLTVVRSLFKAATRDENPSIQAAMFWLKNRAGWKEALAPGEADAVNTLAIEFVGPRAIVEAVRAARGPVINGEAHQVRTVHDVEPEASATAVDEDANGIGAADADADGEAGDMTNDDAAPGRFEAPLPEPDPEP